MSDIKFSFPLRQICGNLSDCGDYGPFGGLAELLKHNSMSVYFDVKTDEIGSFTVDELPTTAARAELIIPEFRRLFHEYGRQATILDLACSPGYFMFKLAEMGFLDVKGVDARPEHQAQFSFLRGKYGYEPLGFTCADMYDFLNREITSGRKYDIILLFGFLYHTATPVELLRCIKAICRGCLIIDTTLSDRNDCSLHLYEEQVEWSRASTSRISFMPSLSAIEKLFEAAGFSRCDRVVPDMACRTFNPGGDNVDYYFDQREAPKSPSLLQRLLKENYAGDKAPGERGARRAFFCAYP